MTMHSDEVVAGLIHEIEELEELIRWLAIPFGENDPVLPETDFFGNALPRNVVLKATWDRVVRGEPSDEAMCRMCGDTRAVPGLGLCAICQ